MKTNKFFNAACGVAVIAGLMFSSCKKESNQEEETASAEDQAMAENVYSDINAMAGQAADISSGAMTNYRLGDDQYVCSLSCATISRDSVNKIITITFNGGTCLDGRTRSGVLTVNYSASENGATHYRAVSYTHLRAHETGRNL